MVTDCAFFHGYTSNPQLCRACSRPYTEHPTFMKKLDEKKKAAKTKRQMTPMMEAVSDIYGVSKISRKDLIDLCCKEIDKADPLVDFGGTKIRESIMKMMREIFVESQNR